MKRLLTGVQDFRDFHADGLAYVDKTEQIYRLLTGDRYYFLSRPRRFGKSLLISTMKELFLSNRAVFEGTWIYDRWDWGQF